MIPKKIHYCWFGRGEKPRLAQKCIASWKRFCPDYEIIEWNEDNFDAAAYPYAKYCLENRKWAFLSDFVRLVIVREYGGIYFDTDVELLRSPEALLEFDAFFGFETDTSVNTGLGFGAAAHHPTVCAMADTYLAIRPDENGAFPQIVCPALNTQALVSLGLKQNGMRQTVAGAEILPIDFLNPYDDPTGRLCKTENTVSVHWYSKSWMSKGTILRSRLTKPLHRLFGVDAFRRFRK